MKKIAISAFIGAAAALLLGAAYFGAPYLGINLDATQVMALAAVLAFGASTSAFMLVALNKPTEKKKPAPSTRFSDLPATEFIYPLREVGALQIVMRPDSALEVLDIIRHPSSYVDTPILVTIKKSSEKRMFNPIILRDLFDRLKTFSGFQHVLLVNEHDEFIGYIPGARVRSDFIGAAGVSAVTKYIINVLSDPTTSSVLRDIGGLSIDEVISDNDTVAKAVELTWDGLKRGLVICKGKRNRKPVGIIFKEDLYRLAANGA